MKSPFKFLDSYTREDREIFFGRDREIEEMYQKVFESKILLVYGISGTGKTSLIDCGLANKFEESDWLPVTVRRGSNIVDSFIKELEKAAISPVNIDSGKGKILKAIQSIYLDHFKPVYLIFDQFEELFIFGDRDEREQFIEIIKAIIESDLQCKFIFSIREEYLASITEFELAIPDFLANRIRIEKMTQQHAVEVIEGPCKVQNIEVEENFADTLLEKLNPEGNEVELTYLQVFLDKIYKLADEPGKKSNDQGVQFSLQLLDKAGDVSDLLGSFLEEQISELDDPETGLIVLKAFVSVKGTKRQITEDEVVEFSKTLGKQINKEDLTDLIQHYVNLRILRDKDENDRYELRHDSLAAKIFEKITLVEKELLEVRQFIENAYQTYEKRQLLLTEKDLRYLKTYEERLFLEGKLKEYVDMSRKVLHKKQRQFKAILRLSLAGFILFVAAIGYYYYQIASAERNIRLSTISLLQSEHSPEVSFHSALEAYYDDTTSSLAQYSMINSFNRLLTKSVYYDSSANRQKDSYNRIFDFNPCNSKILSAGFSKNGEMIYGYLEDHTVKLWNKAGLEIIEINDPEKELVAVKLTDNNRNIGIINSDSTASVWNINGEKLFEISVALNPVYNDGVIDFSPDGKFLAAAGLNFEINLYDLSGRKIQELSKHTGNINYLSISPNGRFIASASDDKKVFIWSYNSNSSLFELYDSITHHWHKVRSCNFSKNSKFILTTADDSTFMISKLDGKWVYDRWMGDYWWPHADHACNAEFSYDEKCILITRYRISEDSKSPHSVCRNVTYSQSLEYDNTENYLNYLVNNRNKLVRPALENYPWFPQLRSFIKNRIIEYDAVNKMVSIGNSDMEGIIVVSHDLVPLMKLEGNTPSFSPDGNYLLYIHDKELFRIPVTSEEVLRLAKDEKILGDFDSNPRSWFYLDYVNTDY